MRVDQWVYAWSVAHIQPRVPLPSLGDGSFRDILVVCTQHFLAQHLRKHTKHAHVRVAFGGSLCASGVHRTGYCFVAVGMRTPYTLLKREIAPSATSLLV